MNNVCLVGRITKDIELRKTQTGLSVASFTVAVNRLKKKDEEKKAILQGWESVADREKAKKDLEERIKNL